MQTPVGEIIFNLIVLNKEWDSGMQYTSVEHTDRLDNNNNWLSGKMQANR